MAPSPASAPAPAPAATTASASASSAGAAASQDASVATSKKATPATAAAHTTSTDDPTTTADLTTPPGEAAMLVSEFPPPPPYYRRRAMMDAATGRLRIRPPAVPREALARGTRKAKAAADRARAEAERMRLGDSSDGLLGDEYDKTGAILGGVAAVKGNDDDDHDGNINADDVVAVFGEIVEDPMLVEPLDLCENPKVVRDEVKRLNEHVLQLFVKLVQDLVHRPADNKKTRDELSHGVFLMLQECNKFREHQAREVLIDLLEQQLAHRERLAKDLDKGADEADRLLLHLPPPPPP